MRDKSNFLLYVIVSWFFAMVFIITASQIFPSGIWRSLVTGKYILQTKIFPYKDIFSFTAENNWIAYSWLAEIIFYKISLFGFYWLSLFRAVLVTLTFAIVFKAFYNRTESLPGTLFIILLSFFVSILDPFFMDRAPLFSFFFVAIYGFILSEYKYKKKDYLWAIPVIMVLWVNMHILFVMGFVLLFLFVSGELIETFLLTKKMKKENRNEYEEKMNLTPKQIRKLGKVILWTFLVCFLNPYGYHLFVQIFEYVGKEYVYMIDPGLQSCDFHRTEIFLFEILFFLWIVNLFLSLQTLDLATLFIFLFFMHHGLHFCREVPFFCIVVPIFLAPYFKYSFTYVESKLKKILKFLFYFFHFEKKSKTIITVFLMIGLFIQVLSFKNLIPPFNNEKVKNFIRKVSPIGAINFIEQNHLLPNMFNPMDWGGYLSYQLYPQYKIAADYRIHIYSEGFLEDYFKIKKARSGWREVFDKYKINFVIWNKESCLTQVLMIDKNWKLVYNDKVAVVFIRNCPGNEAIISKFSIN
jgi:hypothetical protein